MTEIEKLLSSYRAFKESGDLLKLKMDAIKAELSPLIEVHGNFEDIRGYIRNATRKPSVTFTAARVNELAEVWLESNDDAVQLCGRSLMTHRKERSGSSFLQIK